MSLQKLCRFLPTVCSLLCCVLLCFEGVRLGLQGKSSFTAESIGAAWGRIGWSIILWLLLAAAGVLFPQENPVHAAARERRSMGHPPVPHRRSIRITLLIAALLLICLGIMNGGMRDVLIKAINICTECIGLG